jgi:hypothetical protein
MITRLLLLVLVQFVAGRPAVDEISQHYSIDRDQLEQLGGLLKRLKEHAHRRAYHGRSFSHDVRK